MRRFRLLLCALERECLAPNGAYDIPCHEHPPELLKWGGCHRFDRSLLNVLLANTHQFNTDNYVIVI